MPMQTNLVAANPAQNQNAQVQPQQPKKFGFRDLNADNWYSHFNPLYGIAGSLGGGLLAQLFGGKGEDPVEAATPDMENALNAIRGYRKNAVGYMSPYQEAGLQGMNKYGSLLSAYENPQEFYNNIMSGFSQNPAQKFQQNQALEAIQNQAGMQGMMGTGNLAKEMANYVQNNVANQQQQYFNNLAGIYGNAVQGNQNLMGQGFNAATNAGNYEMQAGRDEAELMQALAQMKASRAKDSDDGGMFGSLGSSLGSLAGFAGLFI